MHAVGSLSLAGRPHSAPARAEAVDHRSPGAVAPVSAEALSDKPVGHRRGEASHRGTTACCVATR